MEQRGDVALANAVIATAACLFGGEGLAAVGDEPLVVLVNRSARSVSILVRSTETEEE